MLKRICIYLKEMFPLTAIIGSILTGLTIELLYLRLNGVSPKNFGWLLIPAMVSTSISLLIRIMDEFKDYSDDLKNFPQRPLPSGRVSKNDLTYLAWFCVLVVIFLSITSLKVISWALIMLAFTGLMFKWFFIENIMRKNLPLAFITHHPIVIFNFIYLILASDELFLSGDGNFQKAFYVLPICLVFTNWEIMRKIRAPKDETSYTTYSKIMGPRGAMSVALILQLLFSAGVLLIFQELKLSWILIICYILVQLVLMAPNVVFLFTLKNKKPFKDYAEAQILVVVISVLVAALL